MIAVSGLPSRSRTCCQVASFEGSGVPCHLLGDGRDGLGRHRQPRGAPRLQPAIEHAHVRVAEVLEKPERARGAHPGVLLVDDDRTIGRHAAERKQVPDHPHERAQRRLARVDQTHAPEIEMDRGRQMPAREVLGRPQIDDQRLRLLAPRERRR